eukprot:comp8780_c0_seq1/m.4016 comp8780_c0_seq1/g.4016  ORF comp8780_c0_seq1/g.4016 comp8780_c0_seq1/m.4016 type:complete len:134 (-) comp8780_c0_seq1:471-872(-)
MGIQHMTMLNVIDNTGARLAMCIKNIAAPTKPAKIGDEIAVVIKKTKNLPPASAASTKQQVKKAEVHRAVVVRTRARAQGWDGRTLTFGDNACVLINKKGEPLGTRFLSRTGALSELVNARNTAKLAALAPQL